MYNYECAGRLFHAVGADIENELSTQRNNMTWPRSFCSNKNTAE